MKAEENTTFCQDQHITCVADTDYTRSAACGGGE